MDVPHIESTQRSGLGWFIWDKLTMLQCPAGHRAVLSREDGGHVINSDGRVAPSAVCPGTGCTFHETVRLLEWKTQPPTSG